MKEYVSVIAAILAGISAIISALFAWKLKGISDDRRDAAELRKERHAEAKALYESTFLLFEQAIREVWNRDSFTLAKEFSQNNARIHLLAPEHVVQKYSEVAGLLESWSSLHAKASPQQYKRDDETVIIIQAPDPTARFKEPAKVEHTKLQDAFAGVNCAHASRTKARAITAHWRHMLRNRPEGTKMRPEATE